MWIWSIFVGLAALSYSHAKFGDLVIQTASGVVEGWERASRDGRVYQAWTGIPYAEPPLGELRFMPPKAKSPWDGVLNGTVDAPSCLQVEMKGSGLVGSEDCLYLNVYRPKINRESMPVLVYVHGGGFQTGNMGPRETADFLMDEDVVLVTIQYRLNVMGFMSLGDAVVPGNFGLKDQVQALRWVKENIARFGGNPNSVTVFGESAGGASTHILLKSPATDDLVHRAVSDSGTLNRVWSLLKSDSVKKITLSLAKSSGCTSEKSQELLKCLQKVDATALLTNMKKIEENVMQTGFLPVIEPDDAVDPVATFDITARPTDKPWMTSICPGEWLLFKFLLGNKTFPSNMREYLVEYLSNLPIGLTKSKILEGAEILEKFYFSRPVPAANLVNEVSKLQQDLFFIYPSMASIAMHTGPKWMYRFEYVDEISSYFNIMLNNTGHQVAGHAAPVYSYLNKRSLYPTLSPVPKPEDTEVSKRMIKYLVNFAYHDDPTPEPSPFKWKQFNDTEILRITGHGDVLASWETAQQDIENIYTLWTMEDTYALWDKVVG